MPTLEKKVALPLTSGEFTTLVRQHQGALCSFLCGLVGNIEQARDLAQEVFQDAWRLGLQAESPFIQDAVLEVMRRWLFQAAYYRAISALRRRRRLRWESLEERHEQEPETFSSSILFEDEVAESDALRVALERLAPRDVACLLLRIVQGFSAIETAHIIGASPQSVDQRLCRAKQRLRTIYLAQAATTNSNTQSEAR
jgi:RNA polymerase sigma-70 factor (ECF subfamily)